MDLLTGNLQWIGGIVLGAVLSGLLGFVGRGAKNITLRLRKGWRVLKISKHLMDIEDYTLEDRRPIFYGHILKVISEVGQLLMLFLALCLSALLALAVGSDMYFVIFVPASFVILLSINALHELDRLVAIMRNVDREIDRARKGIEKLSDAQLKSFLSQVANSVVDRRPSIPPRIMDEMIVRPTGNVPT